MFRGGKSTCFAYGQTGSGKTFTMMGSNSTGHNERATSGAMSATGGHLREQGGGGGAGAAGSGAAAGQHHIPSGNAGLYELAAHDIFQVGLASWVCWSGRIFPPRIPKPTCAATLTAGNAYLHAHLIRR